MQPRILAFSGSARAASWNTKVLREAVAGARETGAEVNLIDLRDFPLPLYNGDLEEAQGLPDNALKLKQMLFEHHGLLLAAPEYNASVTPLLKNTIDWMTRPAPKPELDWAAPFANKVVALVSASTGALAGLRGLIHLRFVLSNLGMLVLPGQVGVPRAESAFDDDGKLRDVQQREVVRGLGREVVRVARLLAG